MSGQRDDHILIWMRDSGEAARLTTGFEREGVRSTWAAALPEAIAAVERAYPAAIAATLHDSVPPSLMDVETLLAYLKMGNASVALPPIPIWARAHPTPALLSRIEELELPIQIVPVEQGMSALRQEIVQYLQALPPARPSATGPARVLYMGTDARVGRVISRYLRAAGMPTTDVRGALDVLEALESARYQALVADFSGEPAGRALMRALSDYYQDLPVLAIAETGDWLASLPPHRLPRNLITVLAKPVSARLLELCLGRLLRVPVERPLTGGLEANGPRDAAGL